jgi:hypothetical protein
MMNEVEVKELKKKQYELQLAGFPATESSKMIDKLFIDIIPRALATGRLKPNPDMSLAFQIVSDFQAEINASGGIDLWDQISTTANKLMAEGYVNDDIDKINKAQKMLEQIDVEKWTEYKKLSKKVITTTINSMGASQAGPVRLDDIMKGFSQNFQVNMAVDKKGNRQSDEVLDLQ